MDSVNAGGSAKALAPEWPARSIGILNMSPRSGAGYRRRSADSEMSSTGICASLLITTQEQPLASVLCALITPRGANHPYCRCSTQLGCAGGLSAFNVSSYATIHARHAQPTLPSSFLRPFSLWGQCLHKRARYSCIHDEYGTLNMASSDWAIPKPPFRTSHPLGPLHWHTDI